MSSVALLCAFPKSTTSLKCRDVVDTKWAHQDFCSGKQCIYPVCHSHSDDIQHFLGFFLSDTASQWFQKAVSDVCKVSFQIVTPCSELSTFLSARPVFSSLYPLSYIYLTEVLPPSFCPLIVRSFWSSSLMALHLIISDAFFSLAWAVAEYCGEQKQLTPNRNTVQCDDLQQRKMENLFTIFYFLPLHFSEIILLCSVHGTTEL